MKKRLISFAAIVAVACGCASIHVVKTAPDGSKIEASARSLLSNSAIKGMKVDGTTKTTTNLLSVTGTTTEPNPEAITATAEGLGTIIGTATAAAAKGAVK